MQSGTDSQAHRLILVQFCAIAFASAIGVLGWNYVGALPASRWSTSQGRVELGSVEEHHLRHFTCCVAGIDCSC
jgi:hypothetical protein